VQTCTRDPILPLRQDSRPPPVQRQDPRKKQAPISKLSRKSPAGTETSLPLYLLTTFPPEKLKSKSGIFGKKSSGRRPHGESWTYGDGLDRGVAFRDRAVVRVADGDDALHEGRLAILWWPWQSVQMAVGGGACRAEGSFGGCRSAHRATTLSGATLCVL